MKKNNQIEPAVEADVLREFDRLREVLADTHTQIPALLAHQRSLDRELGVTESEELKRQLADVAAERESACRRRTATIDAIMQMEPVIQTERAAVEAQRQEYAVEAVAAFQARYTAAVAQLQGLWEEGRILGATLRCEVKMELPVTLKTSPVDGVARAQPVLAGTAVTVDPAAARLGQQLDQLDGSLSLCNAIRQSREFDLRHHRLGLLRGTPVEHSGVYRVLLTFRNLADGLEFQPGTLVDSSLVGPGMMSRLQIGRRHIEPVELNAAA